MTENSQPCNRGSIPGSLLGDQVVKGILPVL
jgi:hypothetical protein